MYYRNSERRKNERKKKKVLFLHFSFTLVISAKDVNVSDTSAYIPERKKKITFDPRHKQRSRHKLLINSRKEKFKQFKDLNY